MLKITGIDKLQKQIKELEKAFSNLDGELGIVNFNPYDPVSIESAIEIINGIIDKRLELYTNNPIIESFTEQMKERYRESILQKARETRLKSEEKK